MQWTTEQWQIIEHDEGHARVIAVAGSGKTRTLVGRTQHLLGSFQPQQILVLMYNKDACQDFRLRLQGLKNSSPNVLTFHSLALKILLWMQARGHLTTWQFNPSESAYHHLVRSALDRFGLREDAEDFTSFVTYCKSALDDPLQMSQKYSREQNCEVPPGWLDALLEFEELRKKHNWLFFDDLLQIVVETLVSNEGLATAMRNRKEHILVDEFQDVNPIQISLLKCLAGDRARLMVVGDPDQCIYSFRGATPEYMVSQFVNDFTPVSTYHLSYTFRYGPDLSQVANLLIAHNVSSQRKPVTSHEMAAPTLVQNLPGQNSLAQLLKEILKNRQPEDIALLLRLNHQSLLIELELNNAQIPFRIDEEASVFRQPCIQGILAWMKLFSEDKADFSSPWLYRWPAIGLSQQALAQIEKNPIAALKDLEYRESSEQKQKSLRERRHLLLSFDDHRLDRHAPAFLMAGLMREHGLEHRRSQAAKRELPILDAFLQFSLKSGLKTKEFLKLCQTLARTRHQQGVSVVTMHRSKGLEWPVVVIPQIEEKTIPYHNGEIGESALQAERRLFYVGMTRARDHLILLSPSRKAGSSNLPSRFLLECNLT